MENILFIHSNSVVEKAVDLLKNEVRDQLNVVNDFDEGLRLVFEKRPAVIFIQHEISGVSSIAVANHIKTLLRDNAPQIVLLHDDPSKKIFAGRELFDEVIVIETDETALFHDFLSVLQLMPAIDFKNAENSGFSDDNMPDIVTNSEEIIIPQLPDGATFDSHDPFSETKAPNIPESEVCSENNSINSEIEFLISEEPDASDISVEEITLSTSKPIEHIKKPVLPESEESVANPSHLADSLSLSQNGETDTLTFKPLESDWIDGSVTQELPPYEQVFSLRKERSGFSFIKYGAAALLIALITAAGYLLLKSDGSDTPIKQSAAVVQQPQMQTSSNTHKQVEKAPAIDSPSLPSIFSSLKRLDGSNSASGWETRKGSGYVLKIYRENSRIRAVQLVADSLSPIPDNVISSVLDMAGDGFTDIGTTIQKGITLKQKKNPRGSESVSYFRKGAEKPIAVVVSFN